MIRTIARLLLVVLALTQVLDVLSTKAVLAAVPDAIEGNPVMRLAMDHLGDLWWLPKAALAAFYLYAALHLIRVCRVVTVMLGSTAVFYIVIVAWNLHNLL